MRFVFLGSRFTLHASSPRSVALAQLRFACLAVASSAGDLHPEDRAHAGRTVPRGGLSPPLLLTSLRRAPHRPDLRPSWLFELRMPMRVPAKGRLGWNATNAVGRPTRLVVDGSNAAAVAVCTLDRRLHGVGHVSVIEAYGRLLRQRPVQEVVLTFTRRRGAVPGRIDGMSAARARHFTHPTR